jgi:hypothetical protein
MAQHRINLWDVASDQPIGGARIFIDRKFRGKTNAAGDLITDLKEHDILDIKATGYVPVENLVHYTDPEMQPWAEGEMPYTSLGLYRTSKNLTGVVIALLLLVIAAFLIWKGYI